MKKFLLLGMVILCSIMLYGCSSEKKEVRANDEVLTEAYQEYDAHLQERVGSSNNLLGSFSDALDSIYTGSMSNNQFAKILKDNIIEKSSELVNASESYDVHPSIFEINQSFVSYVNTQHQLFLDAIDMANEEKLNKDQLRKRLVELKETQASIINNWKQT